MLMQKQRHKEWRSLNIEMERMSKEKNRMCGSERKEDLGKEEFNEEEIIRPISEDPWKHLFSQENLEN